MTGMKKLLLVLLVGAAVVGVGAIPVVASHDDAPQDKVVICHKPGTPAEHTLTVAQPAVAAHLAHGDTVGPCGGYTS